MQKYKNIYDQDIILMYKGQLTFDLTSSIISTLEQRLDCLEENRKTKKKFYSVATECIQNLYYHIDDLSSEMEDISSHDINSALLVVSARKTFYYLQTGNFVLSRKVGEIEQKLDNINSIPYSKLREVYKEMLSNGSFSDKGTGGLGFIDIARKTGGQKLSYSFHVINDELSFFTLSTRLPRN